tara:strand:- start:1057 stop:1911 length:855 start_codon:yes stop_codon:yes gene_type:complete
MNCSSITDYILKLERENRELQSLCDEQGETIRTLTFNEIDLKKQVRDLKKKSPETYEESRNKIEQLKNLLNKANQENVSALNSLAKAADAEAQRLRSGGTVSLYDKTASPIGKSCPNQGIVDRLLELGEMTSDFYKTAAYQRAAEVIRKLDYGVESGESLLNLKGIGKGIATKIDEYLEEEDSDYQESVASNDYDSESDNETVDFTDSDDDYFVSHNTGISDLLYEYADKAEDNFRRNAYIRAADMIYELGWKVTLKNLPQVAKLRGIGKSITKKISDYLHTSS